MPATAAAKRAPVMKRTRSPRATRWRATSSRGLTWPWIGTLAMRIEDMIRLLPVVILDIDLHGVVFTTMSSQSIQCRPDVARPRGRTGRSCASGKRRRPGCACVAAAAELFAELGYARTTLAKIAAGAGVSVETVQAQGSKAALMIASAEFAAFGVAGDHNILDLDIGRRFVAITDRDEAVDFIVAEQTAIHERSAGATQALYGAAANDPELDGYLGRAHRRRRPTDPPHPRDLRRTRLAPPTTSPSTSSSRPPSWSPAWRRTSAWCTATAGPSTRTATGSAACSARSCSPSSPADVAA